MLSAMKTDDQTLPYSDAHDAADKLRCSHEEKSINIAYVLFIF